MAEPRTWISIYISLYFLAVITYPCPGYLFLASKSSDHNVLLQNWPHEFVWRKRISRYLIVWDPQELSQAMSELLQELRKTSELMLVDAIKDCTYSYVATTLTSGFKSMMNVMVTIPTWNITLGALPFCIRYSLLVCLQTSSNCLLGLTASHLLLGIGEIEELINDYAYAALQVAAKYFACFRFPHNHLPKYLTDHFTEGLAV